MPPIVINQHYIPRSYLKNFGFLVNAKKRKWSLYAMENGGEIKRRTTENICSVDYLYDLPFASGDERQFLEHAYEEHADRHFPKLTEFLTNESNKTLDASMRETILKSCLSLYFRTPKFVELDQMALDQVNSLPEEKRQLEWYKKKQTLLEESVYNFEKLYTTMKDCGISINKSVGSWQFISGDNPVIFRNRMNKVTDVFSSDNMIHIPLTPQFSITILPANEKDLKNTFNRLKWDDDQVMSLNHDIEESHQQFLLGTEKALEVYLDEVPFYKAPASPNHPKIVGKKSLASATEGLLLLTKKYGAASEEVKTYFQLCWDNIEDFRNDPNAQDVRKQLGLN